jgi:hypothetical protein
MHSNIAASLFGDPKRGFGVYADRAFKQGTLIVEYLGELFDDLVVAARYGDRTAAYVLRFLRSSLFVDGAAEWSLGAMLNDGGAESNCVFLIAGIDGVNGLIGGRPGFWVAASKDINPGDELEVSYSSTTTAIPTAAMVAAAEAAAAAAEEARAAVEEEAAALWIPAGRILA